MTKIIASSVCAAMRARPIIMGIESYAEADLLRLGSRGTYRLSGVLFVNAAFISSGIQIQRNSGVKGNQVEFVPKVNIKTGLDWI